MQLLEMRDLAGQVMMPESKTQAFFKYIFRQQGFPREGCLFFISLPEPRRAAEDEDTSCFTSLSAAVRSSDSLPTIHLYHKTAS